MTRSKALFQFIFTLSVLSKCKICVESMSLAVKQFHFSQWSRKTYGDSLSVFSSSRLTKPTRLFSVCLCWSSQTYQSKGNYSCEALVSCICLLFNQTSEFLQFAEKSCIGKQSLWLLHFLSHLPAPDTSPNPDCSVFIQKMRLNSLSQIWYAISVKDLVPLTFQLEGWNINIRPLLCKDGKLSPSHFLLLLLTHPFHIRKLLSYS